MLSVAVTVFNGLVLAALISLKYYQTPSKFLLVVLAGNDLLHGVTALPLYTVYMRFLADGTIHCLQVKLLILFGYVLTMMSGVVIWFIAVQLYLGIVRPFWYQRIVSRSRLQRLVTLFLIILLTTVIFFTFVAPTLWRWFKTCVGSLFLLLYILLWATNICIIGATKKMNRVVDTLPQATNNMLTVESKVFRIIITITLIFGICYLPFISYAMYTAFIGLSTTTRSYFGPWIEIVGMSNSLFDPVIYCIRMKSVRTRMKQLLRIKQKDGQKKKYTKTVSTFVLNFSVISSTMLPTSVICHNNWNMWFQKFYMNNAQITESRPSSSYRIS